MCIRDSFFFDPVTRWLGTMKQSPTTVTAASAHQHRPTVVNFGNSDSRKLRLITICFPLPGEALDHRPGYTNSCRVSKILYYCTLFSDAYEDEAKSRRKRRASVTGGVQGNGEGRDNSHRETAVFDESGKETAERVARNQGDQLVQPVY